MANPNRPRKIWYEYRAAAPSSAHTDGYSAPMKIAATATSASSVYMAGKRRRTRRW